MYLTLFVVWGVAIAIASCDLPAIPVTIGKMNVPALVDSGSAAG